MDIPKLLKTAGLDINNPKHSGEIRNLHVLLHSQTVAQEKAKRQDRLIINYGIDVVILVIIGALVTKPSHLSSLESKNLTPQVSGDLISNRLNSD